MVNGSAPSGVMVNTLSCTVNPSVSKTPARGGGYQVWLIRYGCANPVWLQRRQGELDSRGVRRVNLPRPHLIDPPVIQAKPRTHGIL